MAKALDAPYEAGGREYAWLKVKAVHTLDLVVLAALFLVIGLGLQPRRDSVRRIFLLTLAFTAAIALIDLVTGGNYMYLRRVPAEGSLLSLMGPWPWYIAVGVLVASVVLVLLDAPFRLWSRRGDR